MNRASHFLPSRTVRPALSWLGIACVVTMAVSGCAGGPERQADDGASGMRWRAGVNADPLGDPAQWSVVERVGVDAVRVPVRWGEVEPNRGEFDWAGIDAVVEQAADLGVAVVATIGGSPAWARHDGDPDPSLWVCSDPAVVGEAVAEQAPPTSPADGAAFAAAVARRYAGRVAAIEAWPEPNLLPTWRLTGPDPEDYAALLGEVASAVRDAAPEMLVVSGGLAPTADVGVCYMSDIVFLRRLTRTGVLAKVDAVGIQPFGLRAPPGEPPDRDRINFRRAEMLHAELVGQGQGHVPLWAVAWGWNVGEDPAESPWGSHEADVGAAWLAEADAVLASWPWLDAAFLWHVRPVGGHPTAAGFALSGADGQLTAVGEAAARVFAGPPGSAPSQEPAPPARPWQAVVVCIAAGLGLVSVEAVRRHRIAAGWTSRLASAGSALPGSAAALLVASLAVWIVSGLVVAKLLAGFGLAVTAFGTVGVLAAAGVVWAVAARPELGAAAALAVAPFHAALTVPLGPRTLGVLEAVSLAVAAGGAWAWMGRAGPRPGFHKLDGVVVALVVWGAAAVQWADLVVPALREWRVVLLEPALVYAVMRSAPRPREAAERAIDGLVLGAVAASVVAGAAMIGGGLGITAPGLVAAEGVVRASGPYGSPNNLALFAGRAALAAIAIALWGAARRRRTHAIAAIVLGLAIASTFSRGALFIGLPVALGLLLARGYWAACRRGPESSAAGLRNLRRVAAIGIAGVIVFVVVFGRTERIAGTFDAEPGSTLHLRLRLWSASLDMGRDYPVLGVGPDNFLGHYRDTYVRRDAVTERHLSHPHNLLLDTWVRLGIPGFVLMATVGVVALRAASKAFAARRRVDPLAAAALGMLAYAMAHGLVDNFFFVPDLALTWWVAVAAALAPPEPAGDA